MDRFFDPEKPGQVRKVWRKPLLGFLALLGLSWAGYFAYANAYPRTIVTACVHIVLMLLSAPFVVGGVVVLEMHNAHLLAGSAAVEGAEQRSRRIGWTGILLVLAAAGVLFVATSFFTDTVDGRGKALMIAGTFGLPGFLMLFYAKSIDHALAFPPSGLERQELESWIAERLSVARFARNVVIFIAAMGAVCALFWYHPEIMEGDQTMVEAIIIAACVLWVLWKVRRDRERKALVPAGRRPKREFVLEPLDAVVKWQYGLFAAGVIWAWGASEFIPRGTLPPLGYVPLAGMVICIAGALAIRLYSHIRSNKK